MCTGLIHYYVWFLIFPYSRGKEIIFKYIFALFLHSAFNSIDLQKQLEDQGATTIQSLARGWLVRRQMARLRETVSGCNAKQRE